MPDIDITTAAPLSISELLISLAVGTVLALTLSWHYQRFGHTLSNRGELGRVFVFVTLTTVLIISVVKSSLALSLGLVGALSIVRFRTPIKEPEESLAYLFVSIAVGLGLGANQWLPTIAAFGLILVVVGSLRIGRRTDAAKSLYLAVELAEEPEEESVLKALTELVHEHAASADLRRVNRRDAVLEATFFVSMEGVDALNKLVEALGTRYGKRIGVSFIDQTNMPSA